MNIQEDLKAYVDGELTQSAADEIRRELDTNDELRNEATLLRILGQEIREMAIEPAVVGAEKALAAPRRRRRWSQMPGWAFAGLLALLVVPGAVLQMSGLDGVAKVAAKSNAGSADSGMTMAAAKAIAPRAEFGNILGGNLVAGHVGDHIEDSGYSGGRRADVDSATATPAMPTTPTPSASQLSEEKAAPSTITRGANNPVVSNSGKVLNGEGVWVPPTDANDPNRMVEKDSSVAVQVDDVPKAAEDCQEFVIKEGHGFIQTSSLNKGVGGTPEAHMSVQVRSDSFEVVMSHVKALALRSGDLISYTSNNEDVTAQYVDASNNLDSLGQEEEAAAKMVRQANRNEKPAAQQHLVAIRGQIAEMKVQANEARFRAKYSTIQIDITQRPTETAAITAPGWAEANWSVAVDGLRVVGRFLGSCMIYLFVFCPLWIPILTFLWFFSRRRV